MRLKPTAGPAPGADEPSGPRDRRVSTSDVENRAFSLSCGCLVGTSASSHPRFVVPAPHVRGDLPTRQWAGEAGAIDPPEWPPHSGAREHGSTRQQDRPGQFSARCGAPAKRQPRRQALRRRCTIPAHPASSPRRPHLWMLVWRTSRPEGLELVTEAQQLWNDCSDSLRSQVSEATWKAWFASIRPVAVANGTLVLAVPSGVVRDRLEGRFHGLVHDALLDSSGKEVQFRFDVQIDDPGPDESRPEQPGARGGTSTSYSLWRSWQHNGKASPRPRSRTHRVPTTSRSTRSTPSTPSSPGRRTASPTRPRSRWPRRPHARTTPCSSTAPPGWARLISCRPWATTCGRTSRACASATCRPRPS